ncbi:hypothetical protein [Bacillus sp. JJ1562]|uniref:hypothetical protein n=1 Tax=Bacillus sp. JJ1562 TaxID=3122960 RepID=UPI0030010989
MKVTVKFRFEGIVNENENMNGLLLDRKVLVADNDGVALYNAIKTDVPSVYLVDLDRDGKDYLNGRIGTLVDLYAV